MIYSPNVPKRWSFQKNCTGVWSFLYHKEGWHFFFPKIWYFFTDAKWKTIFLKKYMETWCFLYVGKGGILLSNKYEIILLSKKQRWPFPKNTGKDDISSITEKDDIHPRKEDIGILDWHSRKSSNGSQHFYGDLFMCFHILLSSKKPWKLNLKGWNFTLSVSCMVGDILQWRIFDIFDSV